MAFCKTDSNIGWVLVHSHDDHERGTKLHIMSGLGSGKKIISDIESDICYGDSQFTWSLPRQQTFMIRPLFIYLYVDTTDVRMYVQDVSEQNVRHKLCTYT